MLNQINSFPQLSPPIMKLLRLKQELQVVRMLVLMDAFRYTDGDVIHTQGGDTTIIDCYFNFIDKTVQNLSSVMTTLRLMGDNNLVSHNTIHKTSPLH